MLPNALQLRRLHARFGQDWAALGIIWVIIVSRPRPALGSYHLLTPPSPPGACRERAAGTYYSSAYFLAKITADMVFQLPMPIIFSCIVYPLIGLQPLGGSWTCSPPLR
jgi:hypothetical protein